MFINKSYTPSPFEQYNYQKLKQKINKITKNYTNTLKNFENNERKTLMENITQ